MPRNKSLRDLPPEKRTRLRLKKSQKITLLRRCNKKRELLNRKRPSKLLKTQLEVRKNRIKKCLKRKKLRSNQRLKNLKSKLLPNLRPIPLMILWLKWPLAPKRPKSKTQLRKSKNQRRELVKPSRRQR